MMEARQLETLQGTYRTGIFSAVAASAELEPVGVKTAGQSVFFFLVLIPRPAR